MEKRYAFKLFYLGYNYYGFQRQPDVPTIEGEVLNTLYKLDLVAENPKYTAASRTDRGAHALGQVIAINLKKEPNLKQINEQLPSTITLWAKAVVDKDFNARRKALYRHYKYVCKDPGADLELMKKALKLMVGVHNFKNLCYKPSRTTIRRIYLADVERPRQGLLVFSFYGASFARGLIRKAVAAIIQVGIGQMDMDEFERLLDPNYKPKRGIELYPSEGLFLVDAYYPVAFELNSDGVEKVRRVLECEMMNEDIRGMVAQVMLSEFNKLVRELGELSEKLVIWTSSASFS